MDDDSKVAQYEEMDKIIETEHTDAKSRVTNLYNQSRSKLKENFSEIFGQVKSEINA